MKTAIKVFEILAIVFAAFTCVLLIFILTGLFSGNEQVIESLIKQSGDALTEATRNQLIVSFKVSYSIMLVWEIVRIVIASLTLKKVKNPIEHKPICLGILNIFFGSFVGGILLFFLEPGE